MILATPQDFEPNTDEPSGLYWPAYGWTFSHATRAKTISELTSDSVVVWGCAYGYLVDELIKLGINAVGYDASEWAIMRGNEELPHLSTKLFIGDCRDIRDEYYPVAVTEDMLPCLTDDEIQEALFGLRNNSGEIIHIVTSLDESGTNHDKRLNWKSFKEWQLLLAPDKVLGTHGDINI